MARSSRGILFSDEGAGEGGKVGWFVVVGEVNSFVVVGEGRMGRGPKRASQSISFSGLNDDDEEKEGDISVSNPISSNKGVVASSYQLTWFRKVIR